KRHSAIRGKVSDLLIVGLSALGTGVDIDNDQLVRFLLVENLHCINRITNIFRILETNGLDEAAVLNQQAGDDAWSQHFTVPRNSSAGRRHSGGSSRGGTAPHAHSSMRLNN